MLKVKKKTRRKSLESNKKVPILVDVKNVCNCWQLFFRSIDNAVIRPSNDK